MTLRLLICFSLCLAGAAMGQSVVSGEIRLSDSREPAVRKGRDYSGVVVWLEPLQQVDARWRMPSAEPARMEQRDKTFVPHVLAVQAGTPVYFPNLDPIFHSAFSNFSGQIFDLGLYAPGTGKTVVFQRTGIVHIFCNIHPTMSAIIAVLRYPWFAVTDARGAWRIPDVPPGEYRLRYFHERALERTLEALSRVVTVGPENVTMAVVTISETGYVESPHKNKYGHDYPNESHDHAGYVGGNR